MNLIFVSSKLLRKAEERVKGGGRVFISVVSESMLEIEITPASVIRETDGLSKGDLVRPRSTSRLGREGLQRAFVCTV